MNGTCCTLDGLFDWLLEETGVDFSCYRINTMQRRLEKRRKALGIETEEDYYAYIQSHPEESGLLFEEFLIGVTSFFRDPATFSYVEKHVLPSLYEKQPEEIRLWVPGCSTGPEVYSYGMLLCEYREKIGSDIPVRIFATELNPRALAVARKGVYSERTLEGLDADRRGRFFVPYKNAYKVTEELRRMVCFSRHNLLSDPPYGRMDLVSCRNLLIYLKPDVQSQVISLFRSALTDNGYLVLGTSERVEEMNRLFKQVDIKNKIYQAAAHVGSAREWRLSNRCEKTNLTNEIHDPSENLEWEGEKDMGVPSETSVSLALLDRTAEGLVVIDDTFRMAFIRGGFRAHMTLPEGKVSGHIKETVSPELWRIIRWLIEESRKSGKRTVAKRITLKGALYNLEAETDFMEWEGRRYHALFLKKNESTQDPIQEIAVSLDQNEMINTLEGELDETREQLQTTVEILESANEELRATNEELLASNEEIESTNEELHSLNEELQTANQKLEEAHSDIKNLLVSTIIGMVFLDRNMHIRHFTPGITEHLDLTEDDIGRAVGSFSAAYAEEEWEKVLATSLRVLRAPTRVERIEIRNKRNDRYYLARITPYYNANDVVGGVVISFINITRQKEMEEALRLSQQQYALLFENMSSAFALHEIICDKAGKPTDYRFLDMNPACEKMIGPRETYIGKRAKKVLPQLDDDLVRIYGEVALTGKPIQTEYYSKDLDGHYHIHVYSPAPQQFATIFLDITDRVRGEQQMRAAKANTDLAFDIARVAVWDMDLSCNQFHPSGKWFDLVGCDPEKLNGTDKYYRSHIHPDDRKRTMKILQNHLKGRTKDYRAEFRFMNEAKGEYMWISEIGRVLDRAENGAPLRMVGLDQDVTGRKALENRIREQEQTYRAIFENSPAGIFHATLEGEILEINTTFAKMFGYGSPKEMRTAFGKKGQALFFHTAAEKKLLSRAKKGKRIKNTMIVRKNKSGEPVICRVSINKLEKKQESQEYLEGNLVDVTEQALQEEKLRYMASHDVLTEVFNRNQFEEYLTQVDEKHWPLGMAVFDVDGLKIINDAFGHQMGDRLLTAFSTKLKTYFPKPCLIFRIGGDEFTVMIPNADKEREKESIGRLIQEINDLEDFPFTGSVSWGLSVNESGETSLPETFKQAEDLMYKRKLTETKSTRSDMLNSLVGTLQQKTHETRLHSERMENLAVEVGTRMGLSMHEIENLRLLARLHDIGKIAISDDILKKPGPLTPQEWVNMKRHSEIGYRIAINIREVADVAEGILCHHEWWDGSGYPAGRKEDRIPVISRIISVVDAYDAMTNDRVYRAAVSHEQAVEEILRMRGVQFDPEVVDMLVAFMEEKDESRGADEEDELPA